MKVVFDQNELDNIQAIREGLLNDSSLNYNPSEKPWLAAEEGNIQTINIKVIDKVKAEYVLHKLLINGDELKNLGFEVTEVFHTKSSITDRDKIDIINNINEALSTSLNGVNAKQRSL